jgi:hypothetical protein
MENFLEKKYEKYVYISHGLSPPRGYSGTPTPNRSHGTLIMIHAQGPPTFSPTSKPVGFNVETSS